MPTYMLTSFLLTRPQRRWVNKAGVTLLTAINNHAVKHRGSAFHSSLRKIMHVTACYMPCMHHVSASRLPLGPCAGGGMQDAGYELPRIRVPRTSVNSASGRSNRARAYRRGCMFRRVLLVSRAKEAMGGASWLRSAFHGSGTAGDGGKHR
jgi:hypothetical protein